MHMRHEAKSSLAQVEEKFTQAVLGALEAQHVLYYDAYVNSCNAKGTKPDEALQNGFADKEFWETSGEYIGDQYVLMFKLKKEKKPSVALRAFLQGFTIADCGTVLIACQYAALLELLGDDKFNALFPDLSIHQKLEKNKCTFFYENFEYEEKMQLAAPQKGDHVYKTGVSHYPIKHPRGHALGWHLVAVGNGKFKALGTDLVAEDELNQLCIDAYNKDRTSLDQYTIKKNFISQKNIPEKVSFEDVPIIMGGMKMIERPHFPTIVKYMEYDLSAMSLENRLLNILKTEDIDNLCKFLKLYSEFAKVEYLKGYVENWHLNDQQFIRLFVRMLDSEEMIKLIKLFKSQLPTQFDRLIKVFEAIGVIHSVFSKERESRFDEVNELMWERLTTLITNSKQFEEYLRFYANKDKILDLLALFENKLKDWLTPKFIIYIFNTLRKHEAYLQFLHKNNLILDNLFRDSQSLLAALEKTGSYLRLERQFKFLKCLSDETLSRLINNKEILNNILSVIRVYPYKQEFIIRLLRNDATRSIVLSAVADADFLQKHFENQSEYVGPIRAEIEKLRSDTAEQKTKTDAEHPSSRVTKKM